MKKVLLVLGVFWSGFAGAQDAPDAVGAEPQVIEDVAVAPSLLEAHTVIIKASDDVKKVVSRQAESGYYPVRIYEGATFLGKHWQYMIFFRSRTTGAIRLTYAELDGDPAKVVKVDEVSPDMPDEALGNDKDILLSEPEIKF